jgi:hypothetical protein
MSDKTERMAAFWSIQRSGQTAKFGDAKIWHEWLMTKPGLDAVEFARCFLRLANLPNFALDRLSRYEATLWRQGSRMLYALEKLDRRKPQERMRRVWLGTGSDNSTKSHHDEIW